MKRLFLFAFLIPVFATAQVKNVKPKPVSKPVQKTAPVSNNTSAGKPADGFLIQGDITGYDNGTSISLLNGSTGATEQTATLQNGKFQFTGKVTAAEFRLIGVNAQRPFITLYIENNNITLTAKKDDFDNAVIKGSPSNDDYAMFAKKTKPYEDLLTGKGRFEVNVMDQAATTIEQFVTTHTSSLAAPLAIYFYNQVTGDYAKLESFYNSLSAPVKATPTAAYLAELISKNNEASYGKAVADFIQPDTSGKNISLSSFRGKYVLVDFWASWCGPCRAENPNVVSSFEKYKNKNFTVLSISLDRAKQPWLDAIKADGLNWTHVSDLQFWNNAVAQQFGINNIPQNMLLDPQGNLIGKNLRGVALDYRLSKILN